MTSFFNNNFRLLKTIFFVLVFQCGFAQYKIPEKPSFQTSVYDYANVLGANEKAQLEEKLVRYSDSTTTQIVVIMIPSLEGDDVNRLATDWAQTWGFGDAKDDNGVIILVAKAERKIALQAGYGLEDRLTAGIGGQIIRNIIKPEFKAGNFFMGLDKGTDEIFKVFAGKYKGERKQKADKNKFPVLPIIILIVILLVIFRNKKNDGNSNNHDGGIGSSLLDVIILSSLAGSGGGGFGGGGFGGGSSGGGGFGGGFGGGGFSGGGSSGDW